MFARNVLILPFALKSGFFSSVLIRAHLFDWNQISNIVLSFSVVQSTLRVQTVFPVRANLHASRHLHNSCESLRCEVTYPPETLRFHKSGPFVYLTYVPRATIVCELVFHTTR